MLPPGVNALLNAHRRASQPHLAPLPVASPVKGAGCRAPDAADAAILCRDLAREPEVAEVLDFVRTTESRFRAIRRAMSYLNPDHATDHKDARYAAGWAGAALLPMAMALLALKRGGIEGDMLECGVFKGGTTACMSHVCAHLGIRLHAADSFAGLPHGSADGYYARGQFLGRYEEVVANVERFGRPEAVGYVKGWFGESLRGFRPRLALLFLDTDLYDSSADALGRVAGNLSPDGLIFSDGLGSARDFRNGRLVPGSDEARAIFDHLERAGVPQKAVTTGQDFLGLVAPGCAPEEVLAYSPAFAKALVALLGNEPSRAATYAFPSRDAADIAAEMLADSALAAIELRDALADHKAALAATERLVAERDAALRQLSVAAETAPVAPAKPEGWVSALRTRLGR